MVAAIIGAANVRIQHKDIKPTHLFATAWGGATKIVYHHAQSQRSDISLQYGGLLKIITVIIYLITVFIQFNRLSIL